MFGNARLKLTAIYTAIIAAISILFSVAIALTASNEISRPINQPKEFVIGYSQNIEDLFQSRAAEAEGRVIAVLIVANIIIIAAGATSSYFLARWTLKPIEEAMENQARFVSDASHELKTPLAAIIMENEVTLRDKKVSREELKDQIKSNLDEVDKLRSLTEYLLDLAQDQPAKISNTKLKPAAVEAIKKVDKVAKAKRIKLINKVGSHEVRASHDALVEILSILLDNAIKYSPDGSTVRVNNQAEVVMVSDEGPGISDQDMPHIFDRFYRADKARTSDGHGLGLALAKKLADRIGADIAVSNNQKQGATFAIKLSAKSQNAITK